MIAKMVSTKITTKGMGIGMVYHCICRSPVRPQAYVLDSTRPRPAGPRLLAVANSNRFTDGTTGITSVAILDVRDPSAVTAVRTIESESICSFPRGVTLGPDGATLYVANFGTLPTGTCAPAAPSTLQVIRTLVR